MVSALVELACHSGLLCNRKRLRNYDASSDYLIHRSPHDLVCYQLAFRVFLVPQLPGPIRKNWGMLPS